MMLQRFHDRGIYFRNVAYCNQINVGAHMMGATRQSSFDIGGAASGAEAKKTFARDTNIAVENQRRMESMSKIVGAADEDPFVSFYPDVK